jgi:hypothetical protein
MSTMDVTSHRLGSLAPLACLRLAFGFLALLDGVRRPLATVQVASRRTDHRQPPAPSTFLCERSTPGLRTSHVSHPRSRPSCGPVQDCRAHVLCGRRTAPRSGARRPKEVALGRTLSNCVGGVVDVVRGRSPAFIPVRMVRRPLHPTLPERRWTPVNETVPVGQVLMLPPRGPLSFPARRPRERWCPRAAGSRWTRVD